MMHQFPHRIRAAASIACFVAASAVEAQVPTDTVRADSARADSARSDSIKSRIRADSLSALSLKADSSPRPSSPVRSPYASALVTVSGDSVDRLRINGLIGPGAADGLMLRSTSSLMDPKRAGTAGYSFAIVLPSIEFVANSKLPYGQNDGALWAGKGANLRMQLGFTATMGPVRLLVIPELTYSSNSALDINPTDTRFVERVPASRSPYSSPFNVYPYSIDLPWRMGAASLKQIHGGQSSLIVSGRSVEAGGSTENEWWGPALRNPIVMSDNAAGFPHLFLRTRGPVSTPVGRIDARWLAGALHESDWFDNNSSNDTRSLSSLALTWSTSAASPFVFGFTRSVFAPADGYAQAASRFFDAFRNTGHPNAHILRDSVMTPGPDQIFSLFTRAAFPVYGLETYLEWGRADFPVSFRDLLQEPSHSRGYTVGAQWVRPVSNGSHVRFQGEISSVEQSTTYRFRPQGSFYTSRAVIQGYTNEGQTIGNGLGPGSSGGWFAADFVRPAFLAGVTWSRVRFNNDAFFLQPYASRCGHDVTVAPGARAVVSGGLFRIGAQVSLANRYNTFFQNKSSCESGGQGSDRSNVNFSLTVASLGW